MKWSDIPKNTSAIYCYENLINGKKYVGQSVDLRIRIRDHERNFTRDKFENVSSGENRLLWRAVRKYGRKSFSFCVLMYSSPDSLDEKERYYILSLGSHVSHHGYNLAWGGVSNKGTVLTNETRQKMSLSKIGSKNFFFGKTHSKEAREIMSKWRKDNKDKWYSKGKDHYNFGRKHTKDAKLKMSKSRTGNLNPNFGKKYAHASSTYYGVKYEKRRNKWVAYTSLGGKNIYIKQCAAEKDAAIAYDEFLIKNNIPYVLNFPEVVNEME